MKKILKILQNKRNKTLSFEAEIALSFENFEFFSSLSFDDFVQKSLI